MEEENETTPEHKVLGEPSLVTPAVLDLARRTRDVGDAALKSDIEKIKLEDGDILLMTVPKTMTPPRMRMLRQNLIDMLKNEIRVEATPVVVTEEFKVEIVKRSELKGLYRRLDALEKEENLVERVEKLEKEESLVERVEKLESEVLYGGT